MTCSGFTCCPGDPAPGRFHLSIPFFPPWLPGGPSRLLRKVACSPFPGALLLKALPDPSPFRTYWALSRTGPKSAPRMHMGKPVWTASNHFTTISPGEKGEDGVGVSRKGGQWCSWQGTVRCLLPSKVSLPYKGSAIPSVVCGVPWRTWFGVEERIQ